MDAFLHALHFPEAVPDRILALLAAMLLTALIGAATGPWMGNANPLYWGFIDRMFGTLGGRLDRRHRKSADLLFRGFFVTLAVLLLSWIFGSAGEKLAGRLPYLAAEVCLLSLLLTSGTVWKTLIRLYRALGDKKVVPGAYYAISRSTRIDLSGADDFSITRNGMGLAARTFDKGMVAPAFWYVIAGLHGAFIYAGLAALAWRFGKDGFGKGFGTIPLALEKVAGYAPSLLAGLIIALAGLFTPTGGMTRAFGGLIGGKGRAPYEEGGKPVTAMAYALGVGLGGPAVDLEGSALQRRWAGPEHATARLEPGHLRRALYISVMAHLLLAAGLGGVLLSL